MLRPRFLARFVLLAGTLTAAAVASPAVTAATLPDDPLGCADVVFDRSGASTGALSEKATEIATELRADLHVRIEGNLDGDIDGREQRLETECAGWLGSDGLRVHNLLVVMVSPSERSTSIYYGEDFYTTLSTADAQIQEFVMNPRFKENRIERGLIDGLEAIKVAVDGGGVPQAQAPTYHPTDFTYTPPEFSSSSSSDTSDDLPAEGIVVLLLLVLGAVGLSAWAKASGWDTSSSSSGYRRSWSSSSSSFSSHHSSSSSHSSSGSSHHSGGGGSSSHW